MPKITGAPAEAPADEEVVDEAASDESGQGQEVGSEDEPITLERFNKLNSELDLSKSEFAKLKSQFDDLADFADFVAELKKDGIKNSDDVRAFLANTVIKNLSSARQSAEGEAAADYHKNITAGWSQEQAMKMYRADMTHAENAYEKGVLTQKKAEIDRTTSGSVGKRIKALLEKYPLADEEVLRDLSALPNADLEAKAKRQHDKETARQVEYSKNKANQRGARGSDTKPGGAPGASHISAPPDALKDPTGAKAWLVKAHAKLAKG